MPDLEMSSSGELVTTDGEVPNLDGKSTTKQKQAAALWLARLAQLTNGPRQKEDIAAMVFALSPALAAYVPQRALCYQTANGVVINTESAAYVATKSAKFFPSFAEIVMHLKVWESDRQESDAAAIKAGAHKVGEAYYDPRFNDLSPTEMSWHNYYGKREGEGFKALGDSIATNRRQDETEAAHTERRRLHVLDLIKKQAPRVWAILVSTIDRPVKETEEQAIAGRLQRGEAANGTMESIDHPTRRAEAQELDDRLFGTWKDGKLVKPGVHPFDRGPEAYAAWKRAGSYPNTLPVPAA